jgi:WD40 repeat protein
MRIAAVSLFRKRGLRTALPILMPLIAVGPSQRGRAEGPLPAGALVRLGTPRRPPRDFPPERSLDWAVYFLGLAADGRLITAGGDSIRFWDIKTGKEGGRLDRYPPLAVRLSPDGKLLARASSVDRSCHIVIWELGSGDPVADLDADATLSDMAFLPHGRTLAYTLGRANGHRLIGLWDVDRRTSRKIDTEWSMATLAVSPDGKRLAAANGIDLTLWDTATGKQVYHLADHQGVFAAQQVVYSPDGERLASWGEKHPIRVYDTNTGKEVCRIGGRNLFPRVPRLFSPDGRYLAAVGPENTLFLYDPRGGEVYRRLPGPRRLAFLNRPCVWSERDWSSDLGDVAFSADGKTLAAEQKDGSIRLWEVATGEERGRFAGHEDGIRSLAFLKSDRLLVSGGEDGTVLVWDTTGGAGKRKDKQLSAEEQDALWTDLAGKAEPAYRAMWRLARVPGQNVPYLAEKLKAVPPGEGKRMLRAIEALEHDGSSEARRALQSLAGGAADSPLTREARTAVRRLESRPRSGGMR